MYYDTVQYTSTHEPIPLSVIYSERDRIKGLLNKIVYEHVLRVCGVGGVCMFVCDAKSISAYEWGWQTTYSDTAEYPERKISPPRPSRPLCVEWHFDCLCVCMAGGVRHTHTMHARSPQNIKHETVQEKGKQ